MAYNLVGDMSKSRRYLFAVLGAAACRRHRHACEPTADRGSASGREVGVAPTDGLDAVIVSSDGLDMAGLDIRVAVSSRDQFALAGQRPRHASGEVRSAASATRRAVSVCRLLRAESIQPCTLV